MFFFVVDVVEWTTILCRIFVSLWSRVQEHLLSFSPPRFSSLAQLIKFLPVFVLPIAPLIRVEVDHQRPHARTSPCQSRQRWKRIFSRLLSSFSWTACYQQFSRVFFRFWTTDRSAFFHRLCSSSFQKQPTLSTNHHPVYLKREKENDSVDIFIFNLR